MSPARVSDGGLKSKRGFAARKGRFREFTANTSGVYGCDVTAGQANSISAKIITEATDDDDDETHGRSLMIFIYLLLPSL